MALYEEVRLDSVLAWDSLKFEDKYGSGPPFTPTASCLLSITPCPCPMFSRYALSPKRHELFSPRQRLISHHTESDLGGRSARAKLLEDTLGQGRRTRSLQQSVEFFENKRWQANDNQTLGFARGISLQNNPRSEE